MKSTDRSLVDYDRDRLCSPTIQLLHFLRTEKYLETDYQNSSYEKGRFEYVTKFDSTYNVIVLIASYKN